MLDLRRAGHSDLSSGTAWVHWRLPLDQVAARLEPGRRELLRQIGDGLGLARGRRAAALERIGAERLTCCASRCGLNVAVCWAASGTAASAMAVAASQRNVIMVSPRKSLQDASGGAGRAKRCNGQLVSGCRSRKPFLLRRPEKFEAHPGLGRDLEVELLLARRTEAERAQDGDRRTIVWQGQRDDLAHIRGSRRRRAGTRSRPPSSGPCRARASRASSRAVRSVAPVRIRPIQPKSVNAGPVKDREIDRLAAALEPLRLRMRCSA